MNPSLRLRTVLARLAALAVVATIPVVVQPPQARDRLLEIHGDQPFVLGIIDDPDPTGRYRRRPPTVRYDRVVLSVQTGDDESAPASTLHLAGTGLPIVAWTRRAAEGRDVVISRFLHGAWTDPRVVAGAAADERDPQLAQDPRDGSVHLVYWIDADPPRVVHRQAPADLSVWSEPLVLSAPGERAARPATAFHDGALRVVYESAAPTDDALPRLIVLVSWAGAGIAREVVDLSAHPQPSWPRVHAEHGRLWVDWIDAAGEMTWRLARPEGGWQPLEREPFAEGPDRELSRGRIRLRAVE